MELMQVVVSGLLALLPIALVIVGWKVLYRNAQRISTRSETFSIVNDVIAQLNEAEQKCVDCWCRIHQEDFDPKLEWERLMPYVTTIRASKNFLAKHRDISVADKRIVEFRKALSIRLSKASSEPSFEQQRSNSIQNIYMATQGFKEELLTKFAAKYPPVFE